MSPDEQPVLGSMCICRSAPFLNSIRYTEPQPNHILARFSDEPRLGRDLLSVTPSI